MISAIEMKKKSDAAALRITMEHLQENLDKVEEIISLQAERGLYTAVIKLPHPDMDEITISSLFNFGYEAKMATSLQNHICVSWEEA